MKVYIVVATKGRPKETYALLSNLAKQSYAIEETIIVGNEQSDVAGLDAHAQVLSQQASISLAEAGSCHQRNAGLNLVAEKVQDCEDEDWLVIFFDDDFRPAIDWVEKCAGAFIDDPKLMGITGRVLADGVTKSGYDELQSSQFLTGHTAPAQAPLTAKQAAAIRSLYGCNMAFRGTYANNARFDEQLPLYGWLEDVDYSHRALKFGSLAYLYDCAGVHMGVSKGRTSGVRFGYSQVANPKFLFKKGTMTIKGALNIMCRNIISNTFHTLTFNQKKDYRGRLYGNFLAFKDAIKKQCDPINVLKINC